mgnify:CR=1 FL=1
MYNELLSLQDKVALVTGASSGLGAHFAKVLAKAGAKVAVAARRTDKLARLVDDIQGACGTAFAVTMDVTDAESVNHALNETETTLGPIDILINNAGVADSKRFLNVDEKSWDFVMEANLKGAWRVAQAVARRLVDRQSGGSIVNIASILGLRVGIGESSYSASKAALVQLTKSMALELASKNIRVNALCPGYFETEMNADYFASEKGQAYINGMPSKRLGQLSELDAPLLLLAGDGGSFISGVALPVDGGHLVGSL